MPRKTPAPEYPTAGAGIGVLFLVSFVVHWLAVFSSTQKALRLQTQVGLLIVAGVTIHVCSRVFGIGCSFVIGIKTMSIMM